MPERLASLEANATNLNRRVDGHGRSLYGDQGNGGLQGDVHQVALSHNAHVRATDEVLGKVVKTLTGEKGDNGLVGDVGQLKRERDTRQRLLWLLLGAAVTEAMALVGLLLAGLAKR